MNVVDSTTTDTARSAQTTDQAQCRQIKFFSFVLLTRDHRESDVFEKTNNIVSPLNIGLVRVSWSIFSRDLLGGPEIVENIKLLKEIKEEVQTSNQSEANYEYNHVFYTIILTVFSTTLW